MEDQMRERRLNRLASRQDELEQSRTRHEQFRSSMFSSAMRPPQSRLPTLGGNSVSEDSVSSSGTISRIDAAILKARAVDAENDQNKFNKFSVTPQISGTTDSSTDSSSFQQAPPFSVSVTGSDIRNGRAGTGSGSGAHGSSEIGDYTVFQAVRGNNAMRYGVQMDPVDELGVSRDGGRARASGVWRDKPGVPRVDGIPEMNGDDAMVDGFVGGGGNVPMARGSQPRKSTWERIGSVDTSTAARYPGRGPSGGASSVAGSTVGSCVFSEDEDFVREFSPQPPRDQKSSDSSSVSGGATVREGAPEWTPDHLFSNEAEGTDATESLEPGGGGDREISLTPKGYEDPLELPDGNHHISFSKFLEVMTGPGLRVRKHHRAGKGNSGLRVLRYIEEEDTLTWDSHKILGAAQHVLPMADVEELLIQPANRVVLTCVGGRDSYAVFEAANEDAAAVLYVGLERLRRRTAAQNYL